MFWSSMRILNYFLNKPGPKARFSKGREDIEKLLSHQTYSPRLLKYRSQTVRCLGPFLLYVYNL